MCVEVFSQPLQDKQLQKVIFLYRSPLVISISPVQYQQQLAARFVARLLLHGPRCAQTSSVCKVTRGVSVAVTAMTSVVAGVDHDDAVMRCCERGE